MTSSESKQPSVTELLVEWRAGDDHALELLVPRVYEELRRIAARHLRGERSEQTLSATDLLHEAFLRLVDADVAWADRAHFLAVGSRVMRRILVDRSRRKATVRHGGASERVTFDEERLGVATASDEILALDFALEELAAFDERRARVVELVYFGGLSYDEVAEVLAISRATAHRDLRLAKAWLHDRIENRS